MRRVLMILAAIALSASLCWSGDLRMPPAPDDLFDVDLIELDLNAIVAEKEKLWSISFMLGSSQKDLATTELQAEGLISIITIFESLADDFEDATGIRMWWSNTEFDDMKPVLDMYSNIRFKLPESIQAPGIGGRLGFELAVGRTGTSKRFAAEGFSAGMTDEAWTVMGSALYYLPGDLSRFLTFRGVERREIYFGIGAGNAWAAHSVDVYAPAWGLQGFGDSYHYKAAGSSLCSQFMVGGDEFFTPFLSLTYQLSYRLIKQEELKYTNVGEVEASPILIGEGEVATAWGEWFPDFWPLFGDQGAIDFGYSRGDENVVIDFSGFSFQAGLRYHF